MTRTDRILKDSAFYSASTIIAQFIGVGTSIAMRRFLTPEMMGIWTTFLLVLNYCLFAEMGIFTAVEVRIPYLRGEGKDGDVQDIRNTAFTFAVLISGVIAAALFGASFFLSSSMPPYVITGVRVIALIIACTVFYNLYIVMLRADKNFQLLSWALLFNAVAMLVSVSVLTYFFKLKGIYFAALLATLSSWLFIKQLTSYRLKLSLKPVVALSLWKIGFPILLGGVIYTVLLSVDKLMIINMIGARELGYYSIAVLALTYTNTFPKLFTIVLFPNMQEAFGQTGSREHALGYVKKAVFMMAYVFPVVLAAAYFVMPLLVHYVLPKYTPGLDSMRILLLGCFFLSLAPLGEKFAIALNKQVAIIPIVLFVAALGWGLDFVLIKAGYGINGAAAGISLAYFAYFLIVYFYALGHCDKFRQIVVSCMKVLVPFVYAVTLALVIGRFTAGFSEAGKTFAGGFLWLVAYSPMLWYVNRKTEVITRIYRTILGKGVSEAALASEKVMVEEGIEV